MAKTPWRCSQCGTVNEPAANSCRVCGRWPSLFDLQDNAVGDVDAADGEPEYAAESFEPEYAAESYESEATDASAFPQGVPGEREEPATQRGSRGTGARRLARLVIPVGVLLYFLISSYFSSH